MAGSMGMQCHFLIESNRMKRFSYYIILVLGLGVILQACEKDLPPNPFDPYNNPPVDTSGVINLDPNSIEGLYKNVFFPTCANSGCHDGTFEPDFRTIESSYNSLVFQPIIKQDTTDPVTYRVEPGSWENSMLHRRLVKNLGGNSGIMPLEVNPGSDWDSLKNDYIENIKNWINAGAPDLFGNPANLPNKEPQMAGFTAFPGSSNTPLTREPNGTMQIPQGIQNIRVYLAVEDDVTPPQDLTINQLLLSKSRDNYDSAEVFTFQILANPIVETGYSGQPVTYTHMATVNDPFNIWTTGEAVFAKVIVQDAHNGPTEIPGRFSMRHIKAYFSFIIL